ncbi:MAG: peptidoglycan-binding domain-containing protein [bacterium]
MNFKKATSATAVAIMVALTGACSSTGGMPGASSDVDARLKAVKEREAQLAAKEREISAREAAASSASAPAPAPDMAMAAGDSLFPPNAKPGECYARIFIPPKFKTVTEKKLKKGTGERVELIPAKYGTVTEKVLVQEESERIEVIPATYKTVTEKVLVKPASSKLVSVPAKYGNETEKVLVKEGYTTWKKGRGPIQRIDQGTGEIMCLVEVPPVYKTISKRVMVSPPTTKEVTIPAVYKTVTKRVVDRAASTRTVKIPAKYKTVTITKMVQPPSEKRITIPEEYQTVTKTIKVSDGHMEWREILCDTNMTRAKVSEIQRALKAGGFYKGPIDGIVGYLTVNAVQAFQKSKGLPVSPYVTVATAEALGVNPR